MTPPDPHTGTTAHTPGPWLVSRDRERRDIIAAGRVVATAGNMGCAVGYPERERRPHVRQAQADAILIAASPRMLEALEEMLAAYGPWAGKTAKQERADEVARAALRLALPQGDGGEG